MLSEGITDTNLMAVTYQTCSVEPRSRSASLIISLEYLLLTEMLRGQQPSKNGEIALNQLRTIDKTRLVKSMGELEKLYHAPVFTTLA